MKFKACSIAGVIYEVSDNGQHITSVLILLAARSQPYLSMSAMRMLTSLCDCATLPGRTTEDTTLPGHKEAFDDFFLCLAVCNQVRVENDAILSDTMGEAIIYLSSSPDEEALVKAAALAEAGYQLLDRTQSSVTVSIRGEVVTFEVVNAVKIIPAPLLHHYTGN